jgi:hypothetical protein
MAQITWEVGDIFVYNNRRNAGVVVGENQAVLIEEARDEGLAGLDNPISHGPIPPDALPVVELRVFDRYVQMAIRGAQAAAGKIS